MEAGFAADGFWAWEASHFFICRTASLHILNIQKTLQKKQRKWASDVLHAWPGLDEDDYRRILNGHADVKADGNNAIITIKLWK